MAFCLTSFLTLLFKNFKLVLLDDDGSEFSFDCAEDVILPVQGFVFPTDKFQFSLTHWCNMSPFINSEQFSVLLLLI